MIISRQNTPCVIIRIWKQKKIHNLAMVSNNKFHFVIDVMIKNKIIRTNSDSKILADNNIIWASDLEMKSKGYKEISIEDLKKEMKKFNISYKDL